MEEKVPDRLAVLIECRDDKHQREVIGKLQKMKIEANAIVM
jgi:hypothetical protein